jgi:hypothetical protein
MARNQVVVECPASGAWTQLTNANADGITFQVLDGAVEVRGTVGATPPSATDRGYFYRSDGKEYHEGELRVPVAAFAAVSGANRLYARTTNGRTARVIVDHVDA